MWGVEALFWHVPRDRNREVDRLANEVLGNWRLFHCADNIAGLGIKA
jgi:hypothetical protein